MALAVTSLLWVPRTLQAYLSPDYLSARVILTPVLQASRTPHRPMNGQEATQEPLLFKIGVCSLKSHSHVWGFMNEIC